MTTNQSQWSLINTIMIVYLNNNVFYVYTLNIVRFTKSSPKSINLWTNQFQ